MSILEQLNEEQRRAAQQVEGPVLILAGAGTGKTRTVTYRMAHMINELGISPFSILALTFTNKAAKEMKDRVEQLVGNDARNLLVSTFHSLGVRLLKTYGSRLGYGNNFNIYDGDDQKSIIREVIKEMNLDKNKFSANDITKSISKLKEEGITVDNFHSNVSKTGGLTGIDRIIFEVYERYTEKLLKNNAMDFSDLLINTKKILDDPYVLGQIQSRFQYIMVDEYQDTNNIQYEIVSKIVEKNRNICVVGDEDQSIYAFRGANIQNILNFEKDYPEAKVFKLEQNYRSTKNILGAANSIIKNNKSSKGKKLWSSGANGDKIKVYHAIDGYDEASYVTKQIQEIFERQGNYKEITILYRTNAQSRLFEEKLMSEKIPYKIYGGIGFYQRKEIKDIIACLSLINNLNDSHNLYRFINAHNKKYIGDKTKEKLEEFSIKNNMTVFQSLKYVDSLRNVKSTSKEDCKKFYETITYLHELSNELKLSDFYDEVIIRTEYIKNLKTYDEKADDRIDNLNQLKNSIVEMEKINEGLTLSEYLNNVSLVSTTDDLVDDDNFVKLMTVHNSKGLEFNTVFLVGMEEDLFPKLNDFSTEEEEEEERRLCYVSVTRAGKNLYISHSDTRMKWGVQNFNIKRSRFIDEMDENTLEILSSNVYKSNLRNESNKDNFNYRKHYSYNDNVKIENFNPFNKSNNSKTDGKYKINERVEHIKFGKGRIRKIDDKSIIIDFLTGEKKIAKVLADKLLKKIEN